MFVNSDYLNYKYLVSVSDNYVILTNRRNVNATYNSPTTINVVYQYINPSIKTIEAERTYTSSNTFEEIEITDNFFQRADCPNIIIASMLVIFFIVFIINGITRFVKKGGVFFGN